MSFAFINRTIGQFPISIATSLAIESALGVHPDIPVTGVPVEKYNAIYINVRTLIRNFIGSLEKDGITGTHPIELAGFISSEMRDIIDIFEEFQNFFISTFIFR